MDPQIDPPIDSKLLPLLADPTDPDRPPLELRGNRLVNPLTGTSFPIQNGIPQLLPENAIPPENPAS